MCIAKDSDLKKIVKRLIALSPTKIILFGSQATGEANDDSDIDVLVVLKKSEKKRVERIQMALRELRGIHLPVDVIVYTEEEVEKRKDSPVSFINSAMEEGRVIYEQAA